MSLVETKPAVIPAIEVQATILPQAAETPIQLILSPEQLAAQARYDARQAQLANGDQDLATVLEQLNNLTGTI